MDRVKKQTQIVPLGLIRHRVTDNFCHSYVIIFCMLPQWPDTYSYPFTHTCTYHHLYTVVEKWSVLKNDTIIQFQEHDKQDETRLNDEGFCYLNLVNIVL